MIIRQAATMLLALDLNPQLFTYGNRTSGVVAAMACTSGKSRNTAGVTMFTR